MKFICLAYEQEQIFNDMPEQEWRRLRQETLDYVESLRASGQLVDAQPLRSATSAMTVRVRDGRPLVTDGPFAETKEQLGGFFIVEADSLEGAIGIAARWPSARLGTIEVRPLDEELRTDTRYGSAGADRFA